MTNDRNEDLLTWERHHYTEATPRVVGVDEAGRGPLAGPVVASAARLPVAWLVDGVPCDWRRLNDSKQLTARQRERYFDKICDPESGIDWAIGRAEVEDIDRLNILQATFLAMRRALACLKAGWDVALIDGAQTPDQDAHQVALIGGDAASLSIAAASVLAKVTRDKELVAYDQEYPGYGFAKHKGYPTRDHLEALRRFGPCPSHRHSFRPVREASR